MGLTLPLFHQSTTKELEIVMDAPIDGGLLIEIKLPLSKEEPIFDANSSDVSERN